MGNLPLAIDQAVLYIRDTGSSPKELLDLYKSEEAVEVRTGYKSLGVKADDKLDPFIGE